MKRKVGKKTINVLKSETDSLVVQPQEKIKAGQYKRSFTLGDQSYHWIFQTSRAVLYKGDSVLATATKTLDINGRTYFVKQPDKSRYTYRADGKDVINGVVAKERGVYTVNIAFLNNQIPDAETLRILSTYFGLTVIEARQQAGGKVLGYTLGFAVGFALGSALAN